MNPLIIIGSWELDGYSLYIHPEFCDPHYSFYDDDKLIFQGDDFKYPMYTSWGCFPMNPVPTLSRLCRRPGDEGTDPDHFKSYTPRQLAWCQSDRCDLLRRIVAEMQRQIPSRFDARRRIRLSPSRGRNGSMSARA
jgi:hypothetical protein